MFCGFLKFLRFLVVKPNMVDDLLMIWWMCLWIGKWKWFGFKNQPGFWRGQKCYRVPDRTKERSTVLRKPKRPETTLVILPSIITVGRTHYDVKPTSRNLRWPARGRGVASTGKPWKVCRRHRHQGCRFFRSLRRLNIHRSPPKTPRMYTTRSAPNAVCSGLHFVVFVLRSTAFLGSVR